MKNKLLIHKLKNNAELAWAAYGYYDLMTSDTNQLFVVLKDKKGKDRADSNGNPVTKEINLIDIMDNTFADYEVYKPQLSPKFKPDKVGTLDGDFTPTQLQNFFEHYDLLDFYPKFGTKNNRQIQGFHACLFQDKKSKEYTLAIRGSFDSNDYTTDFFHLFKDSTIPFDYLHTMILFYESCAKKYPAITQPNSLNVVGHSLGGSLAQIFVLSFAKGSNKDSKPKDSNVSTTESNQDSIINEVYTFNSPGAKNLKPHIVLDSKQIYEVDESIIKASNVAHAMFFKITKRDPNANWWGNLKGIISQEQNILTALRIYFSKIPSNELKPHKIFLYNYVVNAGMANVMSYQVYPISDTFLQAYQTLTHNYNNRNNKNYRLNISDRIFHIESKNQADKYHHAKESYKENATQHLGKDIEGNYFLLNLNFGGLDSHSISSMAKTLYFYDYLYQINESLIDTTSKEVKIEYELHQNEFLKEHSEIDTQEYREHKKALEYCNRISLAINIILRNIEFQKVLADDVYIPKTPNWLYAIIEQRVFEATIKTQQNKFLIKDDTSNIIEAILYLQQNKVYIQILEEDTIKNITPDSPLSQLFAIQESSFFISTDENTNPLIKDTHTANRLIGYRTPRAKIFCGHHKADTLLVNCYKDVTLKHYPKAINE